MRLQTNVVPLCLETKTIMANIDKDILEYIRKKYVNKGGSYYGIYINNTNTKFFDGAVEHVENIGGYYDYNLTRRKVTRKKCLDKELLYSDIDSAIEYLRGVKSEGYGTIDEEWDSYESYDVYAYRDEMETVDEAAERIFNNYIYPTINDLAEREAVINKKKAEIKRLTEEINKLT